MKNTLALLVLAVLSVGCTSQPARNTNDPLHPAAFQRADAEAQRGYDQCLDSARMKYDHPVPAGDDRDYRDRQWRSANADCQLQWLPLTYDECVRVYYPVGNDPKFLDGAGKACIQYQKPKASPNANPAE